MSFVNRVWLVNIIVVWANFVVFKPQSQPHFPYIPRLAYYLWIAVLGTATVDTKVPDQSKVG